MRFPGCSLSAVQALRCVEVMSLLMQQHLRALVETGLQLYLQMWQEYEVQPGSSVAFAGKGNSSHCFSWLEYIMQRHVSVDRPWRRAPACLCTSSEQQRGRLAEGVEQLDPSVGYASTACLWPRPHS